MYMRRVSTTSSLQRRYNVIAYPEQTTDSWVRLLGSVL